MTAMERGGRWSDLWWAVGVPLGIMGVFWLLAAALVMYPEFGTRLGRLHYAEATAVLMGGRDGSVERALRASAETCCDDGKVR